MAFVRVRGEVDFRELDIDVMNELRPRMGVLVDRATNVALAAMKDALSRTETSPEAPATRTGDLVKSIKRSKVGKAKRYARAAVYTRHFWATVHEYGGRVGRGGLVRIPARPVWRSTFERIEPEVLRIFDEL
jgi:hypothetical protein